MLPPLRRTSLRGSRSLSPWLVAPASVARRSTRISSLTAISFTFIFQFAYVHYWPLYYLRVMPTFAMGIVCAIVRTLDKTNTTMTLQEKVGKTIIQLRKERGLSQDTFAFEAGIDRRYMSDIENGKRNISLDILERVCQKLGIKISELFVAVEGME